MYCSGEKVQTLKDVLLMLTNPKNIPANVSEAQAKKMLVGFNSRVIKDICKGCWLALLVKALLIWSLLANSRVSWQYYKIK